jgi:membrane fusion protein (multidrug efflux system)
VPAPETIFRPEAVEAHAQPQSEGEVLHLSPVWTRWTFRVLVLALVVGFTYAVVGTVNEYATGPAIVRIDGKTDLTARSPGVVSTVYVQPGQRVAAGDLLAAFYVGAESAELQRIRHQFELQLVKVLREPNDLAARDELVSLRTQKEAAESRLAEREVRAPAAGIVSDIRVRPGQELAAGDLLFSLVGEDARFSVVALLPGAYRPMLRPGMTLRLELEGYAYVYRDLVIDSVGDEVVGPDEVRRFLGQGLGGAVPATGPVVLVRASLPASTFVDRGRVYNYFDGMQGVAEARVRSDSVLVTLIPGLRALFHG